MIWGVKTPIFGSTPRSFKPPTISQWPPPRVNLLQAHDEHHDAPGILCSWAISFGGREECGFKRMRNQSRYVRAKNIHSISRTTDDNIMITLQVPKQEFTLFVLGQSC